MRVQIKVFKKKMGEYINKSVKNKIPKIYYDNNQVVVLDSEETIKIFFWGKRGNN